MVIGCLHSCASNEKETLRSLSGALGRAVFLARLLVLTLPRRCFALLMGGLPALVRADLAVEMQGPTVVSFSTNKGPPQGQTK